MYRCLRIRAEEIYKEIESLQDQYRTFRINGLDIQADEILDEIIELEDELKGIRWEFDARIY